MHHHQRVHLLRVKGTSWRYSYKNMWCRNGEVFILFIVAFHPNLHLNIEKVISHQKNYGCIKYVLQVTHRKNIVYYNTLGDY